MNTTSNKSILKERFGSYGLHIILNPAGTYSFVGSIPKDLGYMGKNSIGLPTFKIPVFKTEIEAINYAKGKLPNLEFAI